MTPKRCAGLNAKGRPCRAWAVEGSRYCYWHSDPEAAKAASSKGGRNRAKPAPASEPCDLSTPAAQIRLLELTVDRLRSGDETVNQARAVIYAVSVARQVLDDELVDRIEKLEDAIL